MRSSFILAIKNTEITPNITSMFEYYIDSENDIKKYFDRLFGWYDDLNEFEQGIYNQMLDMVTKGHVIMATIDTEDYTEQYIRIEEFIENSPSVHVINDSEI